MHDEAAGAGLVHLSGHARESLKHVVQFWRNRTIDAYS